MPSPPLVAFTIAARNYIPYAKLLYASLRAHHPELRFFLALADAADGIDRASLDFDIIDLAALRDTRVWAMAERYNITEFCTAIKPLVFLTLMARFPGEEIYYFDPDISVVSPLIELRQAFVDGAQLVLTPHALVPSARPDLFADETMLRYGIYNLGFLGLRATGETRALMQWWADKLETQCVIDVAHGLFVDQKWADLFPALLPGVHVLRHPGYNVAYWNLLQRPVRFDVADATWRAGDAPLRFIHFSGHDVTRPEIFSTHARYLDRHSIGDCGLLLARYREGLLAAGLLEYGRIRYAFRFGGVGQNLNTPVELADRMAADAGSIGRAVPAFDEPPLFGFTVQNWAEWVEQRAVHADSFAAHRAAELALLPAEPGPFAVRGTCAICRTRADFGVSYQYAYQTAPDGRPIPNWREHLDCRCGLSNRIRAVLHAMQTIAHPGPDAAIYVTEQVTQLYKRLNLLWPKTQGSEWFSGHHVPGQVYGGIRHEDLLRLTFADAQFDLVASFDVLEHVEDLAASLRECFRVLRPGGTLLFTAPTQFEAPATVDRVLVREDGSYEYLVPPEYHGNPVDAEHGSLCFRYLGLDVLDQLRAIGFATAECRFYWSMEFGYLGPNQNMIIARKP